MSRLRASARSRTVLVCALAGVLLGPLVSNSASGGPSASGSSAASAPRGAPPAPSAGAPAASTALGDVALKLAHDLGVPAGALMITSAPLRSDAPAPRGADLASRLVALTAGALGARAQVGPVQVTLDAARGAAARSFAVLYLQPEIASGELRVSADLHPIRRNLWDRCANPAPGPLAHAFASARLDAEVRSFLSPIPLLALKPERLRFEEPEVVALHCEDLDLDGSVELLVVSRRNVMVTRFRQGRPIVLRKTPWTSLSPIAPVPWRQPLAFAQRPFPGAIDIGLTDRAHGVRLDAELAPIGSISGIPVPQPGADACAKPNQGVLSDKLERCAPGDALPGLRPEGSFDALAVGREVRADGSSRQLWLARMPAEGRVVLRDSTGTQLNVGRVGAQLALADIDMNGEVELIASRDVLEERDDALVIKTLSKAGQWVDRISWMVPTGVDAVAVCPPDGPGPLTIAMATRGELWLIR